MPYELNEASFPDSILITLGPAFGSGPGGFFGLKSGDVLLLHEVTSQSSPSTRWYSEDGTSVPSATNRIRLAMYASDSSPGYSGRMSLYMYGARINNYQSVTGSQTINYAIQYYINYGASPSGLYTPNYGRKRAYDYYYEYPPGTPYDTGKYTFLELFNLTPTYNYYYGNISQVISAMSLGFPSVNVKEEKRRIEREPAAGVDSDADVGDDLLIDDTGDAVALEVV